MSSRITRVLEPHPRATLVRQMTPVERLNNLSSQLGIDLWIKRDDQAGTTFGGNKSRQLEYYLGAAQAADADTILITGAVQSNFVRTAAASAAHLGMRTIVQLENRVPNTAPTYQTSGNVLLDRMLGVEIMYYPDGEDEKGADAALRKRADLERAAGRTPYVIPLALGNAPIGALGYMRAADELCAQFDGFDAVVVASGSGLTHAGLLAGLQIAHHPARVIGSCVRRAQAAQHQRLRRVLDDLSGLLKGEVHVSDDRIRIWDGALAPGYGQVGEHATSATRLAAQCEGLILDPVYTAKAFAAIPALVKTGEIPAISRVLFVHTGGLASLFAYKAEIEQMLEDD